MQKIKIVFFGTPDFSVPSLKQLNENENISVEAVVTKEDKKAGRGEKLMMSKVKEYALENNLKVFTPSKLKNNIELFDELKKLDADFFVVVAYGKIFPEELLKMPKVNCINGHASLLPKYRGASPIQYSILNGDEKTGTTVMQMSLECDTGDIIYQEELILDKKEILSTLFDKLAKLTANCLEEVIINYDKHIVHKIAQDNKQATNVFPIKKEDGLIDFNNLTAVEIERKIRAFNPWPSAYMNYDNKIIKLWDADVVTDNKILNNILNENKNTNAGELIITKNEIFVKCKNSLLQINELQLESKKRMFAKDLINGLVK